MTDLVIHADWSVRPSKRWAVVAKRGRECWHLSGPEKPWTAQRLLDEASKRRVLAGFDFPIGVPAFWAKKANVKSFRCLLTAMETDEWLSFFDVAETPKEISVRRPFYPRTPSSGAKQRHLLEALGAESIDQLRRKCERATANRNAACPLFWTLGGNQVGRATLSGWKEVIIPAVREGAHLWPFDGDVKNLSREKGLTIAETYPAEAYRHVGICFGPGMSKRRQCDRKKFQCAIKKWAHNNCIKLSEELAASIDDGFGSRADGEDRFDALLGLCGMIEVIDGRRPHGAPDVCEVRKPEGWIFGQALELMADCQ